MWSMLFGTGFWYLSKSIGGSGLPYVSEKRFLESIGACKDGICDIASANGCFLCPYVQRLFAGLGKATEVLWSAIINHTWIVLVVGLIVFMLWKAYEVIRDANKENATLGTDKRELPFGKWFDAIKGQAIRVMVVSAILGVAGAGGVDTMRGVANTIIYPVMSVGTALSMATSGMNEGATCEIPAEDSENHAISGIGNSFMCIIGNLNAVVLSGATSGFAMMNLAWLGPGVGIGGGLLTWIAGLILVLVFMSIGFGIMFEILNVVFNLVFVIVFLPLFVASFAFENIWAIAKSVSGKALEMLVKTAVRVVGITLRVMIISSLISFAQGETMSSNPAAEYAIFEKCERESVIEGGEINKAAYIRCFKAEVASTPGAFAKLGNGWEFLTMMLFVFLTYYVLIDGKLRKIINISGDDAYFKFGNSVRKLGETVWKLPVSFIKKIGK